MPGNDDDKRPGLAIIVNSITPYGVNLDRVIALGIPEVKLHVLVTHGSADFKWNVEIPRELTITRFGTSGEHPLDNPLRRPLWDWQKGGRLIRYLRENRVHAAIINGYRFISYLRVMNYCYNANIPFFVNNDSNIRCDRPLPRVKGGVKRSMYRWWLKRATGVMPMGALGDRFFIKYGADPERLYRVPCWPDFAAFSQVDQAGLARFRQKFRLDGARRYLLYSGRLVPNKRVDLLIDSFAAIARDRPDWDLLVVGDGVLSEELHRRVPEELRSRVVWTGFLSGPELALAYHAADVLVLPSDHEPWALVVQEAMAAGLVVVSSDVSGAAYDLIEDGKSGRIFSRGSLEELKQSLLQVTAADALAVFKQRSRIALEQWKVANEPVAEVRRALFEAGVLKPFSQRADAPNAAIPSAGQ